MNRQTSAEEFLPAQRTLNKLRDSSRSCRGCDLYKHATQTVLAKVQSRRGQYLLVNSLVTWKIHKVARLSARLGEYSTVLEDGGITREDVYVTNAVKHFRWLIRQVISCKPWLQAELEIVRPQLIVCLGATAAQSMLGRVVRISKERGKLFDNESGGSIFVTTHPSAIVRQRETAEREKEYLHFLADIKLLRKHLDKRS